MKPLLPLLLSLPLALQSKVLYGYKVDGKGGWDTPFRWQKDKASTRAGAAARAHLAGRPAGLLPHAHQHLPRLRCQCLLC